MRGFTIVAAALVTAALPAAAQTNYYTATPKTAPAKAGVVTRSTLWKCADGVCSAPRGGERPAVLCELVVDRIGAVSSFTAGGAALDEAALAKCNARAN